MMVVYRVENEKGDGPYKTREQVSWAGDGESGPGPFGDYRWLNELGQAVGWEVSDEVVARLRFGFPSLDAAKRWFGALGLTTLAGYGFRLKAFKVPHALVSDSGKQVMFARERAEEIREGVEPKSREVKP